MSSKKTDRRSSKQEVDIERRAGAERRKRPSKPSLGTPTKRQSDWDAIDEALKDD